MSAHTPGPWEVDPEPQYDEMGNESPNPEFASHVRAAGQSKSVCGTCDGCNRIKMADAVLIAAAPDLLAALKAMFADACDCGPDVHCRACELGLRAIAKAEGKS